MVYNNMQSIIKVQHLQKAITEKGNRQTEKF